MTSAPSIVYIVRATMSSRQVIEKLRLQNCVDVSFDNMIDLQIVVTKDLYESQLYALLTSSDAGLHHTPIVPGTSWSDNDDHLGWITLSTPKMLNTAARIIGTYHNLEQVAISRAIMMQNAFMTAGEWNWLSIDKDMLDVELVRKYIISEPPVSKQECTMHMHMYGSTNVATIVSCALATPAA